MFVAGAAVLAVTVGVGPQAVAAPPRAALAHFACQRALNPLSRSIAVTAVMRPLPGTQHMAVRFGLLGRGAHRRRYAAVRGADLGTWVTPTDPTIGQRAGDVWEPTQKVGNLAAPWTYRFRVQFRWTDAGGHVLGQTTRMSANCYEPELRPDLVAVSLSVGQNAANPAQDDYLAVVRNDGATAAGRFSVELEGAGPAQAKHVKRLRRHSKPLTLTFSAPTCAPGATLTLIVDPANQVADYDRSNNSLTVACPSTS